MAEIIITSDNFESEVLDSDKPVLLDFWATWCGPCKMIAPVIAEIAEEYDGKIKVGKVNVDEEAPIAIAYQIASIPTLLLLKEGKVINKAVGYRSKEQIVEMLNK